MKKLKQILSNKNTVTIIGAILIFVVLYIAYNYKIEQATKPIKVPYAIQSIAPRTKITSDMIGTVEIPRDSIKGKVLTNIDTQIVGRYTNVNCMIPAGSLFYSNQIVKEEELPDSFLINIEDGYVAYNFDVSMKTTYGNSMYPGNFVDIYFRYEDDNGLKNIGKLVENVTILAVKDSAGRHVFENTTEDRSPSQIIFAVTSDIHLLLRKAEYISKNNANIILVPTNVSLKEEDSKTITVTSEVIKQYIESKAATAE